MHGLVPNLSEGVQDVREVARNKALTQQGVDARIGLVVVRQRNPVVGEDQVDDGFADHAELHQAGVGIRIAVLLRQSAEVCKHGEEVL